MLKGLIFALAAASLWVGPAAARSRDYYGQYHTFWRRWHAFPNYAATLPYGWPMIAYSRAWTYVQGYPYGPVPVRVYYIPQTGPRYNVPPYIEVAPY